MLWARGARASGPRASCTTECDPLLIAGILQWNAIHVPFTDAWWQFPIFYPAADALAFSEHLLGVSLIATPLDWLTGNPVVAANLSRLLTFPLCGACRVRCSSVV